MNDLIATGMYYLISGETVSQIANLPSDYGNKAGVCIMAKDTQLLFSYGDIQKVATSMWIRSRHAVSGTFYWTEWERIATITTPQEYDLPLADGMSVQENLSAKYSRDQFNGVIVRGCLVGQKSHADIIATLPVGFRPKSSLEVPAMFGYTAGRVQINTQGNIRVVTDQSSVSTVQFFAVFIAGS